MIRKSKCPDCAEKIEKKFNYCPWCGKSIKTHKESENFGILGRDDNAQSNVQPQQSNPLQGGGLPFGLDKMMGPLIKQLEKELSNLEKEQNNTPRNIKITFGNPGKMNQNKIPTPEKRTEIINKEVPAEENKRRNELPREEAESKVRRLSDKIIYEITTPGIKQKKDVIITKLEEGFEIKAYTKEKCYTKKIPMNIDITNYSIEQNKVIVEIKND